MLDRIGLIKGAQQVSAAGLESSKVTMTISGRVEEQGPSMGFGTQPPPGVYIVLAKPINVNGTMYTQVLVKGRELADGSQCTVSGEVYEVRNHVTEGVQHYAVIDLATTKNHSGTAPVGDVGVGGKPVVARIFTLNQNLMPGPGRKAAGSFDLGTSWPSPPKSVFIEGASYAIYSAPAGSPTGVGAARFRASVPKMRDGTYNIVVTLENGSQVQATLVVRSTH